MSDMGDDFRAMRERKKKMRNAYGINCPVCAVNIPKAYPTILLPQQKCRVCGYRDERERIKNE